MAIYQTRWFRTFIYTLHCCIMLAFVWRIIANFEMYPREIGAWNFLYFQLWSVYEMIKNKTSTKTFHFLISTAFLLVLQWPDPSASYAHYSNGNWIIFKCVVSIPIHNLAVAWRMSTCQRLSVLVRCGAKHWMSPYLEIGWRVLIGAEPKDQNQRHSHTVPISALSVCYYFTSISPTLVSFRFTCQRWRNNQPKSE